MVSNFDWDAGDYLVCPKCGKEQRCGCEICHSCGEKMVKRPYSPISIPQGDTYPETQRYEAKTGKEIEKKVEHFFERDEISLFESIISSTSPANFSIVLTFLGLAVLLVSFVEASRVIADIVGKGFAIGSISGQIRELGFYVAGVLYPNSVRLLLASGFLFIGFASAPRNFRVLAVWREASRIFSAMFGIIAIFFLVSFILVAIPFGQVSLIARNLIPSLKFSLPVLLFSCIGVAFASFGFFVMRGRD